MVRPLLAWRLAEPLCVLTSLASPSGGLLGGVGNDSPNSPQQVLSKPSEFCVHSNLIDCWALLLSLFYYFQMPFLNDSATEMPFAGNTLEQTCALLTTQPSVAFPTAGSPVSCLSISSWSHWSYLKFLCFTSGYDICLVCQRVIKVSHYSCVSCFCISFSRSQSMLLP